MTTDQSASQGPTTVTYNRIDYQVRSDAGRSPVIVLESHADLHRLQDWVVAHALSVDMARLSPSLVGVRVRSWGRCDATTPLGPPPATAGYALGVSGATAEELLRQFGGRCWLALPWDGRLQGVLEMTLVAGRPCVEPSAQGLPGDAEWESMTASLDAHPSTWRYQAPTTPYLAAQAAQDERDERTPRWIWFWRYANVPRRVLFVGLRAFQAATALFVVAALTLGPWSALPEARPTAVALLGTGLGVLGVRAMQGLFRYLDGKLLVGRYIILLAGLVAGQVTWLVAPTTGHLAIALGTAIVGWLFANWISLLEAAGSA